MEPILRLDERLSVLAKPELEPFEDVCLGRQDIVVVCAGFEERSVGVLRSAVSKSLGFKVLIIDYRPYFAGNRIGELLDLCGKANLEVHGLTYDRRAPAGFGDMLQQQLTGVEGRVFIDISGMSRLLIVQALVALLSGDLDFRQCFVVYAEAKTYLPTQMDVEKAIAESDKDPLFSALFLSSGVFEVTVVPELSATSLGANQSRLVFFPSFNADQLIALRQELQPSRYAYIHGIPPSGSNRWRTEAIMRLNHMEKCEDDFGETANKDAILVNFKRDEHFKTCTLKYQETLDCLCKIYGKHGMRDRLLISPTGSKMQVVAVGLFRAFVEDVQIVYPTPRVFAEPKDYTTGVGPIHVLPLSGFWDIRTEQ
jgi:hypothetical protein